MQALFRFLKRLGVLIPGLVIGYLAATRLFPQIERHAPNVFIAIFITYVITAYFLIPAAIRLLRIVLKPKHIPLYCTTPDGFASDPINVGVVGTRNQVAIAMQKAGWHLADRHTLKNVGRLIAATILKRQYPNAPCSSLFLFGRSQDIAFELPVNDSPSHRHHVRFWAVTYTPDPRYRDHVFFWQKHHKAETPDKVLWVGAASKDIGLNIIKHNAQVTHRVHDDTNAERRLIIKSLKKTGLVKDTKDITIGKPFIVKNRGFNAFLKTDGKVTIAELK